MDSLCQQMDNMNMPEAMLLNVETWHQDQIDRYGMYKELISSSMLYKVYLNGRILTVDNTRIKSIRMIKKYGDVFIIVQR